MKTYYIVKHFREWNHKEYWSAHRRGFLSTLNCYNTFNKVIYSSSEVSADDCEKLLRKIVNPIKPLVVRIVRI